MSLRWASNLVGRQLQVGQGVHGGAQPAHGGGLGQAVSHHVADDEGDPVRGQRDDVVPVAAHLRARARRAGSGRPRCTAGSVGSVLGQQTALQFLGAGVLGVVEPGPLQGLGDQAAERGQQGALVVGERRAVRSKETTHTPMGCAGGDQRQEGPCLLLRDGPGSRRRPGSKATYSAAEEMNSGDGARRSRRRGAGRRSPPGAAVDHVQERPADSRRPRPRAAGRPRDLDEQPGGAERGQHVPATTSTTS